MISKGLKAMSKLCHSISKCEDAVEAKAEAPIMQFTLQIRPDNITALRLAAAKRIGGDCEEELEEILGPIADPSVHDCLMALLLPPYIDGCTMISVAIEEQGKAA